MSWKKNGFSYLMWAVYTIITCGALVILAGVVCLEMGMAAYWGVLSAALYVAAVGGIVFCIRRTIRLHSEWFERKHIYFLGLEAVFVVAFLAGGLALRIRGMENVPQVSAYYDAARVTAGQGIAQIAHGAVYFYVRMLHAVFVLFGNSFLVGIWLQTALHVAASLILFFTVRKWLGAIAALVSLGFFTCAPYILPYSVTLSPEMLYFFSFMIATACASAVHGQERNLSACVSAMHGRKRNPSTSVLVAHEQKRNPSASAPAAHERKRNLAACVLTGVLAAVCMYVDVAGALLLLLGIGMVFCCREEDSDLDLGSDSISSSDSGRKVVSLLLCAGCAALSFLLCILLDALLSGKSFEGVLRAWGGLYRPESFHVPVSVGAAGNEVECLALFGLMAFGIFGFLCEKERERISVWVVAVIAVVLAGCLGIFTEEMPGYFCLYLLLVILAGVGLGQCFRVGPAATKGTGTAKHPMAAGQMQKENLSEEAQKDEDTSGVLQEVILPRKAQGESLPDNMSEKVEIVNLLEKIEEETKREKQVQYIENPLPLPKKHVKRILDYSVKSASEKDDFDYSVAEDDDFDI